MAMKVILLVTTLQVLAKSSLVYRTQSARVSDLPIEFQKTPDMIESSGLIAEAHDVTTDDGYIIRLHRIPADKEVNPNKVVILQIGIAGADDNWLLYGNKSLPVMLWRAGYDVWMSNPRGNSYSRKHVKLTRKDPLYWQFSYHEMGYYDLPASIDYALNTTGAQKLFYIGHSRGTTSSYILLSLRPEYNDKLKLLISMAPVGYIKHAKSPLLKPLFKELKFPQIDNLARDNRVLSFFDVNNDGLRNLQLTLCGADNPTQPACVLPVMMVNGRDFMNSKKVYQAFMTHFPAGGSTKELLHYLQLAKTDVFAPYSYSESKNMAVYNATQPPPYPLHKITAPTLFYYSDNDFIVSSQDRNKLVDQLPNVVGVFRIANPKFNHGNFVFGSQTDILLYNHLINFMEKYAVNNR